MLLLLKYFLLHVFPCDLQQDMTISRRIISSIKYGMLICNHFPVIVVFLKLPLSSTVNIWSSLMVDLRDKNMAERLRIKGLFFRLPYHVWVCQILSVDSHSICQGMRLKKKNNKPRLCSWVHMGKNTLSNKKRKRKNPKHSCVIFHSTCKKVAVKMKMKNISCRSKKRDSVLSLIFFTLENSSKTPQDNQMLQFSWIPWPISSLQIQRLEVHGPDFQVPKKAQKMTSKSFH